MFRVCVCVPLRTVPWFSITIIYIRSSTGFWLQHLLICIQSTQQQRQHLKFLFSQIAWTVTAAAVDFFAYYHIIIIICSIISLFGMSYMFAENHSNTKILCIICFWLLRRSPIMHKFKCNPFRFLAFHSKISFVHWIFICVVFFVEWSPVWFNWLSMALLILTITLILFPNNCLTFESCVM